MDGSAVDHSDSDSGESWTLLENHPAYGDEAPAFNEHSPTPFERDHNEAHLDKDEDTDGISIISDSDPELAPCDITCDKCSSSEKGASQPQNNPSPNYPQPPNKKTIESLCNEDDFLGDGSHKLKTYVHRRNKRLSMVLNIIMLGSVITAAGVAIGHMWGAKNDCTVPTPSVNKILSNLYKLQEENAYLRNKLRELTQSDIIQQMQQTNDKKPRCKKIFEGPLNSKVEKGFKCVDPESNESVKSMDTSELLYHEREFLNDIGKLKKVYNQNKSWLDVHIQRRLDAENNMRTKRNVKEEDSKIDKEKIHSNKYNSDNKGPTFKLPDLEEHDENIYFPNKDFRIPESGKGPGSHRAWNLKIQIGGINKADNKKKKTENPGIKLSKTGVQMKTPHKVENLEHQVKEKLEEVSLLHEGILNDVSQTNEKRISYADSLKTESDSQKAQSQINESNELPPTRGIRGYGHNRKHGDIDLMSNLLSSSEEEIKKDDRYPGPKTKRDKNKHDRHKIHKKQKRKNKYEQWEMKGGYLKDFDEFSMTSSQVNLGNDISITPEKEKKYLNNDFENYLTKLTEADQVKKPKKEDIVKEKKGEKGKKGKNKDLEWYDKRYALRAEARRKLEHELFGETSPNNAAWYFRRMNKREQCRAQKDNSTFKKFSKQKMNFKMKH